MVCCAIWYHLYNFKNVKNTHGGVLILVKLQALLRLTLLHGCFSRFLNCTNGTKLCNASQLRMLLMIIIVLEDFLELQFKCCRRPIKETIFRKKADLKSFTLLKLNCATVVRLIDTLQI